MKKFKEKQQYKEVAMTPNNPKWSNANQRYEKLSQKKYEMRSEFVRDYNRILSSTAFSRLKHKTQVFFATTNDHVCTRIEHVNLVASIAKTICRTLGLNVELAEAISFGHDLGHAPFGHNGEKILEDLIISENIDSVFWHEKNSLRMIDHIETLPNYYGDQENLSLTYAVRDGIVCHCGEVDENGLKPRDEFVDLEKIHKGEWMPYTYEGCVVKISDKLAYIGRDIEDATRYGFFSQRDYMELKQIAQNFIKDKVRLKQINPTTLIYELATNLCDNSTIESGLTFTKENFDLMNQVKQFIYEKVCMNERLEPFRDYSHLVINTVYHILKKYYEGKNTFKVMKKYSKAYHTLISDFKLWHLKYSNIDENYRRQHHFINRILYDINDEATYKQSIIDFISSMSDKYILKVYNDIITF